MREGSFLTKSAAKVYDCMRQVMQEPLPGGQELSCSKELFSQARCCADASGKRISLMKQG